MSSFDMRSFCTNCGTFRLTLPFGSKSDFFDSCRGPCRRCGEPGPGNQLVAKRVGFFKRAWVDREGNEVG